jgi:hypothetical protein
MCQIHVRRFFDSNDTFALAKVKMRRYYRVLSSLDTTASPAVAGKNNGLRTTANRLFRSVLVGCTPAFVENSSRLADAHLPEPRGACAQAA